MAAAEKPAEDRAEIHGAPFFSPMEEWLWRFSECDRWPQSKGLKNSYHENATALLAT